MNKHAYLIVAHKDDYTFRSLLQMIDDERNDIFIHMDKKNKEYDETAVTTLLAHSSVKHCKSINCTWGGTH